MITLPDSNSKVGIASTVAVGGAGLSVPAWSSTVATFLSLGVQIASLLYIITMIILNYPKAKKVLIRAFSKDDENQ